jgi:hypothetical protein
MRVYLVSGAMTLVQEIEGQRVETEMTAGEGTINEVRD